MDESSTLTPSEELVYKFTFEATRSMVPSYMRRSFTVIVMAKTIVEAETKVSDIFEGENNHHRINLLEVEEDDW